MLGSCSTGKILKNWSEFNRCHREGQGLKYLLCEEEAAELGLIQPRAEMASGAHLSSPQYLQSGNSRGRARLFTAACDGRVRDNRQKLKLERFKLGMKKFFHCWDSQAVEQVDREAVLSPSVEAVKTHLNKAVSSLV